MLGAAEPEVFERGADAGMVVEVGQQLGVVDRQHLSVKLIEVADTHALQREPSTDVGGE
jgi:hypothetical protein